MYRHDLDPIALVFGALFTVLGLAYAIGHWTWFDFRGGWFLAALLIALGLAGIFSASRRADGRHPPVDAAKLPGRSHHCHQGGEGVMKPLSLGHVVLNVKSCEESERFYTGVLGIPVASRLTEPMRMTFFTLGNHHDFATMEVPPDAPLRWRPAAPVSRTSRSRSATRSTSCGR